MTAPVDRIEGIQKRIASVVGKALMEEVEGLCVPEPRVVVRRMDEEIMQACHILGRAYDALQQAKFSGHQEVRARVSLETAAKRLQTVMRKHGRFP